MGFRVLFLMGPTASGKSNIALEVAEKTGLAIFNCDSIQVYKDLNIGAAKPTTDDFKRAPHFLYDFISYPQEYTAGDYSRDFFRELEAAKERFPGVIVVGGTGFYFKALEKGLFSAGKVPQNCLDQINAELLEEGGEARLYQELMNVDPDSRQIIHPHDHYRLQRALGLWRTYGKTPSQLRDEMKEATRFPYPLQKFTLDIDKNLLEKKIALRTQSMLDGGLIEEVEALVKHGRESWSPLQSIGYREVLAFLRGEIKNVEELQEKINISTRQLTKKQRTWFKGIIDSRKINLDQAVEVLLKYFKENK